MVAFWKLPSWIADCRAILLQLQSEIKQMSEVLNALAAQVARVESVNQSAVSLLQGLHAALIEALERQENGEDPNAVQALADRLAADTDALAAAVAANTIAEAAVPPEAAPESAPAE